MGAAAIAAAAAAARVAPAPIPWGTPSLIADDLRSGEFTAPPGRDRASTFPQDLNDTVLVGLGERRREIDPALLTRLDRAGAYVDNRTLRLRPGALLHGRRKAFVDADPRQRRPGRSTLEATIDDDSASISSADGEEGYATLPGGGSGPSRGGDGEGDSEDSDAGHGDSGASVSTTTSVREGARGARRTRVTHVPRAYRRPRLPVTKFGFFDIDFSRYCGGSPFCGLEDIGPNSLINALVQTLFFTRTLRRRVSRHLCSHPACVACELRFVNDQLAMAPALAPPESRAAAGSTLVRALAFVTEVRRQGLLHGPSAPVTSDPVRRMDALLRVMLDRIGRELSGANADFEMPLLGVDVHISEKGKHQQHMGVGGPRSRTCLASAPPPSPKDPAVADAAAAAIASGSPAPEPSCPDALFGVRTTSLATCVAGHTVARESVSICVDLLAPQGAGTTGYTFSTALGASLGASRKTRAWCEECRAYVALVQARVATSAPPLLLINAGAAGTGDAPTRAAWAAGSDGTPWVPPSIGMSFRKPTAPGEPPSVDVIGAGINGSLPIGASYVYEFVGAIVHVKGGRSGTDSSEGYNMGGALGASGSAAASPIAEAVSPVPLSDAAADAASLAAYHYVAVLRVTTEGGFAVGLGADADTPPRRAGGVNDGTPSSGWWVFNDFRITPTTSTEARNFSRPWKTPCTLIFQRVDHEAGVGSVGNPSTAPWASLMANAPIPEIPQTRADGEPAPVSALRLSDSLLARSPLGRARLRAGYLFPHPLYPSPLTADIFRVPPSAFTLPPSIPHQPQLGAVLPTAGHVAPEALPAEGELAAIDAEFVVCAPERARTLPDGSRRLVAAARNMPGRVTVVTPECAIGDINGEEALGEAGITARVRVLMDEHAVATERVWDHLTRFSGINPGDLDTATSPFRLHAYKATYLRLRALLDSGAVLVGHGLRKDARELNIFVPEAQSADTVRLWKLPQQRYLSLRFLASHLLGLDIQGNVHDSGEDALVALRLYQAWARVRAATGIEGVERLTHALYHVGRASGFRAAGAAAAGAHASSTDTIRTPADVATAALVGAGVSITVLKALGLPSSSSSGSSSSNVSRQTVATLSSSATSISVSAPAWNPRT